MLESLGRNKLSNEAQLLICAARPVMDEKTSSRFIKILLSKIDWSKLKILTEKHRLEPLFWIHLKTYAREFVSEEILKHFENRFIEHSKQNILFASELLKIINAFESEEIILVPYKGVSLAAKVYDSILLRQSVDIDVLIRRKDVLKATELLMKLDYEPSFQLRPHQLSALMKTECDRVFTHNKLNTYLELHWAITPPYFSFPFETENLIDTLEPFKLMEREILMPSTENLILILCVNATKEMWERLEWLASFSQLLKQNEKINWNYLIERATELKSLRMLLLGFHLAKEVFETELPTEILSLIEKDKTIKPLAQKVYTNLFVEEESNYRLLKINLFRLKARESLRDKIFYCLMRLFTPSRKDLNFINLPRGFYWLYYFVRPIRLLTKLFSR